MTSNLRQIRAVLYFVVGFLLAANACISHASIYPATITYGPGTAQKCGGGTQSVGSYSTPQAFGDAILVASKGSCTGSWSGTASAITCSGATCSSTYTYTGSGQLSSGSFVISSSYVCTGSDQLGADSRTCGSSGVCSSTAVASSGLYDFGTSNSASLPFGACVSGCWSQVSGSGVSTASKSWLVSGVRHYGTFMTYSWTGQGQQDVCTVGVNGIQGLSSALSSVPTDTCGSGQYKTTGADGLARCVSGSTGQVVSSGPTYITGTSCSNSTNPDSTIAHTCVTQAADGSTSSTTTTYPAGTATSAMGPSATTTASSSAPSSVSSGSGSGSSGGTSYPINGATNQPSGSTGDYCALHPTADMCKTTTAGTASGMDGAYVKDSSGKTFGSVIADAKTSFLASPAGSAMNSLFSGSVASGSCDFNGSFNLMGHSITADFNTVMCGSTMATVLSLVASALMVLATWAAFRIAILE